MLKYNFGFKLNPQIQLFYSEIQTLHKNLSLNYFLSILISPSPMIDAFPYSTKRKSFASTGGVVFPEPKTLDIGAVAQQPGIPVRMQRLRLHLQDEFTQVKKSGMVVQVVPCTRLSSMGHSRSCNPACTLQSHGPSIVLPRGLAFFVAVFVCQF